jgi:alpha-galactosidase
MVKIAIIGAGSHVFTRTLVTDFLTFPELRDSTITLMDLNENRLELTGAFTKKLVDKHNFPTRVETTTNRKIALEDANYVILSIRVGGFEANRLDVEIPAKYGIFQGVGDTIGPGGVFYALRHIPVVLDICKDMENLCADALLINYTNPMAMICWAINEKTRIKNIGLCHSVQNTASELAKYLEAPIDNITYNVAGINHMAWFLELLWNGEDAYPLLREKFEDPSIYTKPNAHWAGYDIVRAKIFKAFGFYVTESSQHMSEYVPYFRKRPDLLEKYKLVYRMNRMREMKERRAKAEEEMRREISSDEMPSLQRSTEFGSYIIDSIETGLPRIIYANVKNDIHIENLPKGCCVEVPCKVSSDGIEPIHIGYLPIQCAALNRTNINVQELAVQAALTRNKDLVHQAILLDPLTSAILTIDKITKMVDEMFKVESRYLEKFC